MRLANVLASGTAILVALAPLAGVAQTLPWMDTSLPPEQRTALLVPAMTLDEKFEQLLGTPGSRRGTAAMLRSTPRQRYNEITNSDPSDHQRAGWHRPERLRAGEYSGPAVLRAKQSQFGSGDRDSLGPRGRGVLSIPTLQLSLAMWRARRRGTWRCKCSKRLARTSLAFRKAGETSSISAKIRISRAPWA